MSNIKRDLNIKMLDSAHISIVLCVSVKLHRKANISNIDAP